MAGKISKQNIQNTAWFFFAAYSKMREKRDKLRKEFWSKKEPELEDLENSQMIHMAQMLRHTLERIIWDVWTTFFWRDQICEVWIQSVILAEVRINFVCNAVALLDIHRRSTKFLTILYQQKNCQPKLKGAEIRLNEENMSDFLEFYKQEMHCPEGRRAQSGLPRGWWGLHGPETEVDGHSSDPEGRLNHRD